MIVQDRTQGWIIDNPLATGSVYVIMRLQDGGAAAVGACDAVLVDLIES